MFLGKVIVNVPYKISNFKVKFANSSLQVGKIISKDSHLCRSLNIHICIHIYTHYHTLYYIYSIPLDTKTMMKHEGFNPQKYR